MPKTYVDLTHPIRTGMTAFPRPWHPCVQVTPLGTLETVGRCTKKLDLGTHSGTHVDAPGHFLPGGAGVDTLPLDVLMGPAMLLDFSDMQDGGPVSQQMLATALGDARPVRLVLRFGWSGRYAGQHFYQGHPYLTREAARWLVALGVRLLAMDTPQPDDPEPPAGSEDSPIHKILLGAGVILVEYLNNLEAVTSPTFELVVLPLAVKGGDGAPARCVAVF